MEIKILDPRLCIQGNSWTETHSLTPFDALYGVWSSYQAYPHFQDSPSHLTTLFSNSTSLSLFHILSLLYFFYLPLLLFPPYIFSNTVFLQGFCSLFFFSSPLISPHFFYLFFTSSHTSFSLFPIFSSFCHQLNEEWKIYLTMIALCLPHLHETSSYSCFPGFS